ncbi:MAG TPA: S53 family peptidase [Solirubrobacteraceae bacterium]|nr:S53 family peptidase [Solirubrobacteraceae bacterium]
MRAAQHDAGGEPTRDGRRLGASVALLALAALLCPGTSAAVASPTHPRLHFSMKPSTTEPFAACGEVPRGHYRCFAIIVPPGARSARSLTAPLPSGGLGAVTPSFEGTGEDGLSPSDLRSAYKIGASGGSGQTVAIVDAYDDPNAEADLKVYRSKYGLPECTTANGCFKKVNQSGETGKYPASEVEWSREISLDIDMVSALCGECHILLVEANDATHANLDASEDEAVALGATEVSDSWGGIEESGNTSEASHFNHPGVPITVAAGDYGYANNQLSGEGKPIAPNWPAASPTVISVGGTWLQKAENARGWIEQAAYIGGGGCSSYEAKPAWQSDWACGKRMGNDVAAVAETAVSMYDTFGEPGWRGAEGTSVSAPIVAAIEAHASSTIRSQGAEAFYRHSLFDITEGDNFAFGCGGKSYVCASGAGYDGPTGWGSPNGAPESQSEFAAVTVSASEVSAPTTPQATLHGYVEPDGLETTYYFEYGPTTAYGSRAPTAPGSVGAGFVWQAVSAKPSGLARNATYHYRLVATNGSGTRYGADKTFTTTRWTLQEPEVPVKTVLSELEGVSCIAEESACVAVGHSDEYKRVLYENALVERWTGTQWVQQSTPAVSGKRMWLSAVSCVTASNCTAVGSYQYALSELPAGESRPLEPLTEHWNGKEWKIYEAAATSGGALTSISCPSSNSCTAVGWEGEGENIHPAAESWNGSKWSLMNLEFKEIGRLNSVSCVSTSSCTAVGRYWTGTRYAPLVEEWKSGWRVASTPSASEGNAELNAVSCPTASSCFAVGSAESSEKETYLALAEQRFIAWKIVPAQNPARRLGNYHITRLTGVSCVSESVCMAVGTYQTELESLTGQETVAERWNGREWLLQGPAIPNEPPSFAPHSLLGVACAPTCTAVGFARGSYYKDALVEAYPDAFPNAPVVTGAKATGITSAGATLNAEINPEESETTYQFEFGKTRSYGAKVPASGASIGEGGNPVQVSNAITGLEPGTTYHFRATASNAGGTTYGNDTTFATLDWLLNGKPASGAVSVGVHASSVEFGDAKGGYFFGEEIKVRCEATGTGVAGAGVAGELTSLSLSNCKPTRGSCVKPTVEALDLPWHTELQAHEGAVRDLLANGGKGNPGYKLVCVGEGISDECTGATSVATAIVAAGVTGAFDGSSEAGSCSRGGAGTSRYGGSLLLEDPAASGTIAVSGGPRHFWLKSGQEAESAVAVEPKFASFRVTDAKGGTFGERVTVECEVGAIGTVGPGASGAVSSWTASKCVPKNGTCLHSSVEALGLPWYSELISVEGTLRDVIASGGKGLPGYKIKCEGESADECVGNTTMAAENHPEGVTTIFDSRSEKLTCTHGGAGAGSLEGTTTLTGFAVQ